MTGANGIGKRVDTKFELLAICLEHGHSYDHHHAIVFLAKDAALPDTLRYYMDKCKTLGAATAQLTTIDRLIDLVDQYQAANSEIVKVADIDEPEKPKIGKGEL